LPGALSRHWVLLAVIGMTALLFSPLLIVSLPGYSPRDKWLETKPGAGNYHFYAREIYEKTDDIDILVMGGSIMWCGMDTDLIQKELSKHLGRKAVVLSFASNWRQEELYYLMLKELTAHRRVKMLIFHMPTYEWEFPHKAAAWWWIVGEHIRDLADMDYDTFLRLYAVSLLGTPRHLLSFFRENIMLPEGNDLRVGSKTGALLEKKGFGYDKKLQTYTPFTKPTRPLSMSFPPEKVIFSRITENNYRSSNKKLSLIQSYFLKKMFELAAKNNIHVVITAVPTYSEAKNDYIMELGNYRKQYSGKIDMASVAPSWLFGSLPENEVKEYFYDQHMNVNGSTLFTRAMLPSIISLYRDRETRP
jgi:hypothetical protein